ncbi:hypothetical protein [Mycolicibacterium fortuitum]|nr:hypothetical protein [Mycolicibacterium fortuitum]
MSDDASRMLGLESIHVYDANDKELEVTSAYVSLSHHQLHIKIKET